MTLTWVERERDSETGAWRKTCGLRSVVEWILRLVLLSLEVRHLWKVSTLEGL